MKVPKRLRPLVDEGIIDEVIRPLMSGKEADVFVVRCGSKTRCAKIYKDAVKRSFKKAAQYTEGRRVRNSRRARAMEKGSKFGRKQQEETWQNAEVDALYRLDRAGVRVPEPYGCFDGVLLMELITDEDGNVAPRLNDVGMSEEQGVALSELTLDDFRSVDETFEAEVHEVFDWRASADARDAAGGTSHRSVLAQLDDAASRIQTARARLGR